MEKVILNKIDKSLINKNVIRDFTYAEDVVRAMIEISKVKEIYHQLTVTENLLV